MTDGLEDTKTELVDGGTKGRPKVEVTKVVLNTVLKVGDDVKVDDAWTIIGFIEASTEVLMEGMKVKFVDSRKLEELVD